MAKKKQSRVLSHALEGLQYAVDVTEGKIETCNYVKKACQRFIDDLNSSDTTYRWDIDLAEKACAFFGLLKHVKGVWARRREQIHLSPWQCFIIANIFGWVNTATGMRKYTEVYLEIPRKNGKSVTAAGAGLYMFLEDGEVGAEVYCGATTQAQAWEVFRPARLMALASPEMQANYELIIRKEAMALLDGSRFEPVIGKPGDGASPSCSIIDEYHEHTVNDLYETMVTGVLAREQPLIFIVTTAGKDISGPCYFKRDEAIKVLEGSIKNESLFAIIYTIDEPDDWHKKDALRIANPNYGVSINTTLLEQSRQDAINNVEKQVAFKTKHLNVWVSSAAPWIDIEKWKPQAMPAHTIDGFAFDGVIFSLDLASRVDICAYGKLFYRNVNGELHYLWRPKFYLPEKSINKDRTGKYLTWMKKGFMQTCPGDEIRHEFIKQEILADLGLYGCNEFAYDPWRATMLAQELEGYGLTCIEIAATPKNFSLAMYELEAALATKRIWHDGNDVMTWMLSNVCVQKDRRENIYPRKEKPEYKIDGAVALIMAVNRAMAVIDPAFSPSFLSV